MSDQIQALLQQCRQLSPEQRIELAEELLASIPENDAAWDALLLREAQQRAAELGRGEALLLDAEDVFAQIDKQLQKK